VTPAGRRECFLAHPTGAISAGAALLALVILTALVIPSGPLAADKSWSEAMTDIQTPALKQIALAFNTLGHGLARILSLVAIGVILLVTRRWLAFAAFAVTEALTPLTTTVIKAFVDRPRPAEGMVSPSATSFPSGHASYAGATCVALVLLFTAPGPRRALWWAIAAVVTAAMAWSRTYLQVHWLSDVIAGALLGIGISLLVFGIAQQAESVGTDPRATPA
jgi:undecaprenyl-diphosphatase